jgi:hypothetical protein
MNRKTYWTNHLRRRRIGILLEDPLKVQAAEDQIFGEDQNIIGVVNEAILEEWRKEGAEPKDQEGEQASKDAATGEGDGKKKQGLRARVAEMVRGNFELESKSSTNRLRRRPSKMSIAESESLRAGRNVTWR